MAEPRRAPASRGPLRAPARPPRPGPARPAARPACGTWWCRAGGCPASRRGAVRVEAPAAQGSGLAGAARAPDRPATPARWWCSRPAPPPRRAPSPTRGRPWRAGCTRCSRASACVTDDVVHTDQMMLGLPVLAAGATWSFAPARRRRRDVRRTAVDAAPRSGTPCRPPSTPRRATGPLPGVAAAARHRRSAGHRRRRAPARRGRRRGARRRCLRAHRGAACRDRRGPELLQHGESASRPAARDGPCQAPGRRRRGGELWWRPPGRPGYLGEPAAGRACRPATTYGCSRRPARAARPRQGHAAARCHQHLPRPGRAAGRDQPWCRRRVGGRAAGPRHRDEQVVLVVRPGPGAPRRWPTTSATPAARAARRRLAARRRADPCRRCPRRARSRKVDKAALREQVLAAPRRPSR